jgi:hypothetical protein
MAMPRFKPIRRLLVCLVAAGALMPGAASSQAVPEYELKAAYLYNFALFVAWPADTRKDGLFVLCVAGDSPLNAALAALEGKAVRSQRLVVRGIDGMPDLGECQMLYIAAAEEMRLERILALARGRPILTIADALGWGGRGIMINLVARQGRLAFDVNLDAVRQAGLDMSSRLLRLAGSVNGR